MDNQLKNKDGSVSSTLEALLDFSNLNSDVMEASEKDVVSAGTGVSNEPSKPNLDLLNKNVVFKEVCMELLSVIKEQDVNGYFTFSLPLKTTNCKVSFFLLKKLVFYLTN